MEELLRKSLEALGYQLADFELSNRGRYLRIFIEKRDTLGEVDGGINITDCEVATKHLQRVFEVDGIDYDRLEVSSPGLDRKLKTGADFSRFIGYEADVYLRLLVFGRRHIIGVVREVFEQKLVKLDVDGVEFTFDIANLKRARLVPKL